MTNQNMVRAKVIRNGKVIRTDEGPNSKTLRACYLDGGLTNQSSTTFGAAPRPYSSNEGYLVQGTVVNYKTTTLADIPQRRAAVVVSSEYSPNASGGRKRTTNYSVSITTTGTYTAFVVGGGASFTIHAYFVFSPHLELIEGDTVEVEYVSICPWAYNHTGGTPYVHTVIPLFVGDAVVEYQDVDGNPVSTDTLPCEVNTQLLRRFTNNSENHVPLICGGTMRADTNSTYLRISQTQQDPQREALPANQPLTGRSLTATLDIQDIQSLAPEIGAFDYGYVGREVEYSLSISAGGSVGEVWMVAPSLGSTPSDGGGVRLFFTDRPLVLDPEYSCTVSFKVRSEWDPPQGFLDEFPNWVRPND